MKNLVKLTLLAALLLCGSTTYAQKFGYVNSQELITAMPELLVFGQGRITFRQGSDQLLRVDIAEFLRISRTTAQQQRCKQG